MSHAPFDGVLLDDARPPIPGALALLLHLRTARRLARAKGWPAPSLDTVKARAQACQELLAHGLLPDTLRGLQGLDLGAANAPHGLGNLAAHLEAYLAEVEREGYLEPDEALWRAVDLERAGRRGLWVERTAEDGPLPAGLRDLLPARLRALACVPALGGADFTLATRKGGERSGLFGSSQPMTEWFLDGLEQHGQGLPGEISLREPEGWGECPWAGALDGLFEGPLELGEGRDLLLRGLADGPVDLLRLGLEQVCLWLEEGFKPQEITVIHPEPQKAAAFLEPLLAQEGIPLHVRGGLPPLLESATWSPLWMLLMGLLRLDPCAVAAGLRASRRRDLRVWAEILAASDQDGEASFTASFMHLEERAKAGAAEVWADLAPWREARAPAREWAARIEALAGTLRLPMDPDDFFAPMGLLREAWGGESWSFAEMLTALRAFLEAARGAHVPKAPGGLRLVAPGTLLDDWDGARATLVLDLSEGAWPAPFAGNPDLDWNRKAAVNQALLEASRTGGDPEFPPALQRFWLPRAEHGDQIPRAFQQEAYAFNKALAMTRERFVALSPSQDASGRPTGQGPFWNALEGAGPWEAPAGHAASRLRWMWEGHGSDPRAEGRAQAAKVLPGEAALAAQAPEEDVVPDARAAWLRGADHVSPTALEVLAQCPFRSMAERIWGLSSAIGDSSLRMALGTLAHYVLEAALTPFVGLRDWPAAFLEQTGSPSEENPEPLLEHLRALWEGNRNAWLADLRDVPEELWPKAAQDLEALLPNLAMALLVDAEAKQPTRPELAFLFPDRLAWADVGKTSGAPLQSGWTRTLLSLEGELGPLDMPLGEGRSLAVAGKIDRLERWDHEEGLSFLRVTDYKTSKKSSLGAYAEGDAPFGPHLQTPLYILLAGMVHEVEPTAALVPLKEERPEPFTGHLRTLAEEGEDFAWRDRLLRNLAGFDARLTRGDFPPTPGGHCEYCGLGALCGRPVDLDGEEDGDA